ncbi:MAG: class I SAM-dependent methyltransferase [Thermodesulfovibrionales bacterium]
MKLNLVERLITNNPVRAYIQKHFEGPLLKNMAGSERYPTCLEIGCGVGMGAQVIAEQFGAQKVIAIDIDSDQIERAKNNLSTELKDIIEFKVEDAMSMDERDESFDAVFSFGVLHHMEDWRRALKEVARVLKRGGEFFFEEPLRPFLRNPLVRVLTAHPKGGEFDFEEFKEELEANNIEIVKIRRIKDIAIFCVGRKR